jgi:hypothetical protein
MRLQLRTRTGHRCRPVFVLPEPINPIEGRQNPSREHKVRVKLEPLAKMVPQKCEKADASVWKKDKVVEIRNYQKPIVVSNSDGDAKQVPQGRATNVKLSGPPTRPQKFKIGKCDLSKLNFGWACPAKLPKRGGSAGRRSVATAAGEGCTVPDVEEVAFCSVGKVIREPSLLPKGWVLDQFPSAGTQIAHAGPVRLWVSSGPKRHRPRHHHAG